MVGIFGFIGYVFIKLGTEPAPLLLGFILGPMMEEYLRRALLLSRGDWSVFVTRPISAGPAGRGRDPAGAGADAFGQVKTRRSVCRRLTPRRA
jgi:hypothetical protein